MRTVTLPVALVVATVSGAALAFISLESAGIAVLVLVLVCWQWRHRPRTLAKVLAPVGLGYLSTLAVWTLRDPWLFSGPGTESYGIAQLVIGLGILITGLLLLSSTRRLPPGVPS